MYKVMGYIEEIKKDIGVKRLLEYLEGCGQCLLIGGVIKDKGILGKIPKDIDIVVITKDKLDLDSLRDDFIVRINKYEVESKRSGLEFDIMTRESIGEVKKDLIQFNTDNLLVNITRKEYDAIGYNKAVIGGTVKIEKNRDVGSRGDTLGRLRKQAKKLGMKVSKE